MRFTQSGGQSAPGPQDWFTGTVYIDGIRNPDKQSAVGCAHVRFTPGARTAWHSHPKGQTLYVTDGIGYVGSRGGEVREIRPGDVVYIEPGEEHWHGATPTTGMTHIAVQEWLDGKAADWLEPVSDAQGLQRRLFATSIGRPMPVTVLRGEAMVDVLAVPSELTDH